MTYPSCAMEWINMKQLFQEVLERFNFSHLSLLIFDIMFAWRYHDNLATELYKPTTVFKKNSIAHLQDTSNLFVCMTVQRLRKFMDPLTEQESSSFAPASIHVRSVNVNLIQHKELRKAVSMGMNYIPLKPTATGVCIATILEAFSQVEILLDLGGT
jgi:hypothetical protein